MTTATAIEAINGYCIGVVTPKVYVIYDIITKTGYSSSGKPFADTRELNIFLVGGDITGYKLKEGEKPYCRVTISQGITWDNNPANIYFAVGYSGSVWPVAYPHIFTGGDWNGGTKSYNAKHLTDRGIDLIINREQTKCKKCGEKVYLASTCKQEDLELYDAGICPKCR